MKSYIREKPRRVTALALLLLAVLAALGTAGFRTVAQAATTCTTSSASGNCGPYSDAGVYHDSNGSELVAADVWNQISGWKQTLNATDGTNWTVDASMPAGNGAVVSYPDTQVTYTQTDGTTPAMSNFGDDLESTYSDINPTGTGLDYEYAYDVWLNPAGTQSWNNDEEIMIWTDNHGQTPAGSPNGQVYTDAAGTKWTVWIDKGTSSVSTDNDIVSFVRQGNAPTGSVNLSGFFDWLKANNHTNANAGIDQIGYGPELCSTGGVSKQFGLTSYSLTKGAGGSTGGTPTPTPTGTGSGGSTGTPTPTPTGSGTSTPPPPPPTSGSVAYDSAGGAKAANATSLSWTQQVGSGSGRELAAELAVGAWNDTGCKVTLKDNGVALTEVKAVGTNNQKAGVLTVWKLDNPPSGTNTLTASVSGCASGKPQELTGGSESFSGSSGLGTPVSAYGSGSTASVNASGDMLAGFVANGGGVKSAQSPATARFTENQDVNSGAGNSAGATSQSGPVSWATVNDWWAAVAVPVLS